MQDLASDSIGTTAKARTNPVAVFLLALVLGAVAYYAFFAGYPINHDVAVMLHVGDVMLHGGIPYRDFFEITPPMAPAIHMIPVLISNLLPVSQPVAFHFFVTLLLVFSCWLIFLVLGRWVPEITTSRRILFLVCWLTATLSVQLALDYGQREHLFALVLIPWVLCRIVRHEGTPVPLHISVPLGLIASPFFLQKPFFLAVVVAIEIALTVLGRRLDKLRTPEIALLVAWGGAYFVYLATLPADAREELFGFLIPYLSRHYGAYDGDFFEEENVFMYQWAGVAVSAAVLTLLRSPPRVKMQMLVLCLTVFFCAGAYVAQGKGWLYQQIPIRLSTIALLAYVLCTVTIGKTPTRRSLLASIVPVFVCLVLLSLPLAYYSVYWRENREVRTAYVSWMNDKIRHYTDPGDPVVFVSSDLRWAYPSVIYAGAALGSRYNIDFMIPMLYDDVTPARTHPFPYRPPAEQSDVERRYLARRAEDIGRFRPKLIAIDTNSNAQALPAGFQVSEYLKSNGWEETVLAGYSPVEKLVGFQFYVRND